MKKFLAGVMVGSIGTFGALLVEAEKRHGSLKRIAAKALRMYADKLDPKWKHNYAENVLDGLLNKLKKDGLVLVADYRKFSNQKPKYADYDWGWDDLSGAYVYYYNTKGVTHWGIHLPEPIHIEHMT